jgi:hypothetical protein
MSPAAERLVKRLVVVATVIGLGSSFASLLVACGESTTVPRAAGWKMLPAGPIRAAGVAGIASVWTGNELIVTGVRPGPDGTFIKSTNVSAAYDPSIRTWRRLTGAPKTQNYCRRDAVWTGKEMLLWTCGLAAFNPQTDTWRSLPRAPTGEGIVVWTGHELIGWGGGCCGDVWDGGSAYDPSANTWRMLARSPLAPSQSPLGAWTGRKLILVVSGYVPEGGAYPAGNARAAAYDPATDTWRRLAPPPSSALRYGGLAAWDGRELLVIGNASVVSHTALAYDPAADRWRRLARPPAGLTPFKTFWTGRRLLVLGGDEASRSFAYNPGTDRWVSLPRVPLQGPGQTGAWTGHELIVWSSADGATLTPPVG